MKAAIRILLLVCAWFVLFTQCENEPEPEIEFVDISDNAFMNALIEEGVDTDGDGEISTYEAARVKSLDVSYRDISDMTGIDAFIHLDTLDLSTCTDLYYFVCHGNQLSVLDLSNNHNLFEVYCDNNQISSLLLSSSTSLWTICCQGNQLATLDVSANTVLEILQCDDNPLSNLDVSNNPLLEWFTCRNNQLTSLDISNNLALTDIDFGGNNFASLDISNNTNLGTNETWATVPDIILDSIPTLFEVCVWEMPFPPEGVEIETSGSPNIFFTTTCSQ